MAMPLSTAIQTSLRKYRRKKIRTFFGIVLTILLFIFIVLLSCLAVSADKFVHERILVKLAQKEEVLELSKFGSPFGTEAQGDPRSEADESSYTIEDVTKIKGLEHIVDVQTQRPVAD